MPELENDLSPLDIIMHSSKKGDLVLEILNCWNGDLPNESPFYQLLVIQVMMEKLGLKRKEAVRKLIYEAWKELADGEAIKNFEERFSLKEAKGRFEFVPKEVIFLRFFEGYQVSEISPRYKYSEGTLFDRQKKAIEGIKEYVQELEQDALDKRRRDWVGRLKEIAGELPEQEFLGQDIHFEVSGDIEKNGPPYIIAITGESGIGKTTMAQRLIDMLISVERLFPPDIAWVNLIDLNVSLMPKQIVEELLRTEIPWQLTGRHLDPAIVKERLKKVKHLIVVDSVSRLPDINGFLDEIRQLMNPTKFILLANEPMPFLVPGVALFNVPKLSKANSLQLMKNQMAYIRTPLSIDECVLKQLYETVGGNPQKLLNEIAKVIEEQLKKQ